MTKRRDFLAGMTGLLTFTLFTKRVMAEVRVSDPTSLTLSPAIPPDDRQWLLMERICQDGSWSDEYRPIASALCQADAKLMVRQYTRDGLRGLNLENFLWQDLVGSVERPQQPRIMAILNWCRAVGRARLMPAFDDVLDRYLDPTQLGPIPLEEYLPPDLELPYDLTCEEAADFSRLIDTPFYLAELGTLAVVPATGNRPDDQQILARYLSLRRELGFLLA